MSEASGPPVELPAKKPKVPYGAIALTVLRTGLGLVIIFWLLSLVPDVPNFQLALPYAMLIMGVVIYIVVRKQFRRIQSSPHPFLTSAESLILAAAIFLSLFAGFYVMLNGLHPGSFSEELTHFTSLYFALTVFSTVGFGDITPVSDLARGFTMAQMAIGIGFIALLVKVFGTAAQHAMRRRKRADVPQ